MSLHFVSQVSQASGWTQVTSKRATTTFASELTDTLDIPLHTFEPEYHTTILPPALDDPEHAAFSREVKVEPFPRALKTLKRMVELDQALSVSTPKDSAVQPINTGITLKACSVRNYNQLPFRSSQCANISRYPAARMHPLARIQ